MRGEPLHQALHQVLHQALHQALHQVLHQVLQQALHHVLHQASRYIRRKKEKEKEKKVYDELRKAEIGFTSSKGGRGTATSCYAATGVMLLFQTFIKEKKKPEAYGQCITPLGKREGKSYGCFMGRE